jgi:hypothetical protein
MYVYNCTGEYGNQTDLTLAPKDWDPSPSMGGPCIRTASPHNASEQSRAVLYTYPNPTGLSAADLVELQMWYRPAAASGQTFVAADHYVVASELGKADAASQGYPKVRSLG